MTYVIFFVSVINPLLDKFPHFFSLATILGFPTETKMEEFSWISRILLLIH